MIDWLIDCLILLIDWLMHYLIDKWTNWLNNRLLDWYIDLVDSFQVYLLFLPFSILLQHLVRTGIGAEDKYLNLLMIIKWCDFDIYCKGERGAIFFDIVKNVGFYLGCGAIYFIEWIELWYISLLLAPTPPGFILNLCLGYPQSLGKMYYINSTVCCV